MDNRFLQMIKLMREQEEVVVFDGDLAIRDADNADVVSYLRQSFEEESLSYPCEKLIDFDPEAALWGAKTVYIAAQLILCRKKSPEELPQLLPVNTQPINSSAIISADLCLRFLPDMINQLKAIDADDPLVVMLENILLHWPFSGVHYYTPDRIKADTYLLIEDACLCSLYVDRIIQHRVMALAKLEHIRPIIAARLGMHAEKFWKEFTQEA